MGIEPQFPSLRDRCLAALADVDVELDRETNRSTGYARHAPGPDLDTALWRLARNMNAMYGPLPLDLDDGRRTRWNTTN